jgi:DNA-binding transcriptional MerR regulator
MAERENLMPIGRFARAVRLGVKALRHYDEAGLLSPAFVDPQTGYRYYARRQARDALMIAMLRSLDLPLAAIREALVAPPDALQKLLLRESERVAAELARSERTLRSLERMARQGSLAPYAVAVREEPAHFVARLSGTTTPERLVEDSTAWVRAVMAEVEQAGRPPRMPVLCINEEPDAAGRLRVHACAALDPPAPDLVRAEAVELAGGPCAFTTHVGPYEEIGLAHHALFAWVQERGHEPSGPIREIYLNDPTEVAPEAIESEVLLPIGEGAGLR